MAVTDFILFFASLAALCGAVMLALGWFVPRYGYDGHCRQCDYNVSRTPRDAFRCPECGSDLAQPSAIVLGRRRIKPSHVRLGGIAFVSGAPIVLTVAWLSATGRNLDQFKPYWMLVAESNSGHAETELSALTELQARINAKRLSDFQLTELATAALTRGSNRPHRIQVAWRSIYISGAAAGSVKQEALQAFLTQSLAPVIEFREPVRPGDPVPFFVRYLLDSLPLDPTVTIRETQIAARLGDNSAKRPMTLNILGKPTAVLTLESLRDIQFMRSIDRAQSFDDTALLAGIDPGEHEVSGELTVEVSPGARLVPIQLQLPWRARLVVADRSAAAMKAVSPLDAFPESTAGAQLSSFLPPGQRIVANGGRWSLLIHLPKPSVEETIPVRVTLEGPTDKVDCGVWVLDGTQAGPQTIAVAVPDSGPLPTSMTDVRVILSPIYHVALRLPNATATLTAERSWNVTMPARFNAPVRNANRPASQPATLPAGISVTGGD